MQPQMAKFLTVIVCLHKVEEQCVFGCLIVLTSLTKRFEMLMRQHSDNFEHCLEIKHLSIQG